MRSNPKPDFGGCQLGRVAFSDCQVANSLAGHLTFRASFR
jgi:hypothetical protein